MSQLNSKTRPQPVFTHEGARAVHITPLQQLIRTVMSCMLWEDNFYEDGASIAERIQQLVHQLSLSDASAVAIEARRNMKLRHVPLLIAREMARHPKRGQGDTNHPRIIQHTLNSIIQRPDELTEFLAIYWKDGKQPLSKQVKLGLARAFQNFDAYALAKYNRKKDIMLRDVLFLCHSKPKDVPADAHKWDKEARRVLGLPERRKGENDDYLRTLRPDGFSEGELLYGKLIYDQLATPDTWEVELSAGKDKRTVFERLMAENKLGDLAFLRNLRNMTEAGVPHSLITSYGDSRRWGRVLPFRFIAAARVVPQLEPHLERWMFKCLEGAQKLPGKTVMLCDVSSSMNAALSAKSDLRRVDAMRALAMLLREVCEDVVLIPFAKVTNNNIPPRRGFALAELLQRGHMRDGTDIGNAVRVANSLGYDRLVLLTDEQSHTRVPAPRPNKLAYCINVAAHQNGVGYGDWLHIDGFSEAVVDYIAKYEETAA